MALRIVIPNRPPSEEVVRTVAEKSGNKVLLAFSGGKDAIGAWLALRTAGVEVFPYFYYCHPDLGFINRSLDYFEDFFGTRIMRLPAPGVYRWWWYLQYQTPDRISPIRSSSLPPFKQADLMKVVKDHHKLPADTFTALGIRCADSIFRRAMFVRSGAINWKDKKFYPNWDWTKETLIAEMKKAHVKLPVDYWLFGRTFDGLDYRFIGPLKKHYPEDYAKLLEYYPLMDAGLKRAEFAGMTEHL